MEVVRDLRAKRLGAIGAVSAAGNHVAIRINGAVTLMRTFPGQVRRLDIDSILDCQGSIQASLIEDDWLIMRSQGTLLLNLKTMELRRKGEYRLMSQKQFSYPWLLGHPSYPGEPGHVTHVETGISVWRTSLFLLVFKAFYYNIFEVIIRF